MLIEINPEAISIDSFQWDSCPTVETIVAALGNQESRLIKKRPALPKLVIDSLGISIRYSESNRRVHSLLVHFLNETKPDQPLNQFSGSVLLNGMFLKGKVKISQMKTEGIFVFDRRPEPVAIGPIISVRLIPQNGLLAAIDIGWEDFVRYGWG